MRIAFAALAVSSLLGCGKENAGAEEAARQAEAELKAKVDKGEVPKILKPPVTGDAKLDCTKVIDLAAFQAGMNEKEPLTISDASNTDKEATAICNLVRGGKKLSATEQAALSKKEGKLGVLPGDPLCQVMMRCSTIEAADKYRKKCEDQANVDLKRATMPFAGVRSDESMGNFACLQVVPTGAFDAHVFKFFDADTKCVFEVRGGPSNQDNDLVRNCAKTARDSIGPSALTAVATTK
ncbi:MAG: hypothetical protein H0V17_05130 [Deltaproteobacteria bacterium]|nr:hypothetical protein [Deltaproteobacteria bacterium]